jgi:hypothetical protein
MLGAAHGSGPGCDLRIQQDGLRVMQAVPPPLLPLLRSRLQAELLTVVLLAPEQEWSLTELAERVGSSLATAGREVTRAEQAGVVTSRRVGSAGLVRAASSPLTGPLTELLLRSFGPRQVVAEELAAVAGVERAYLFGSGDQDHLAGRPTESRIVQDAVGLRGVSFAYASVGTPCCQ